MPDNDDARRRLLTRILGADSSLNEDIAQLRAFPWDAAEPLVELTLGQACDVLDRHARGALSDADISSWANAIEARDDVELDQAWASILRGCLFELANPELTGKTIRVLAERWRGLLATASLP